MASTGATNIDPETIYTRQECLGEGSFGAVYKGVDKRSGKSVAIKVIDVENADDEVDDIIQEIAILSGIDSPYVTKYYGSYLKGSELWIVMEYCAGGSCGDLLRSGNIPEEFICIIMRELIMGLDYLHADQKIHRDVKAANVLLGANGQVKLADFGVSGQLTATCSKKNTFVGTPFWMAPEVIKQSGYSYKADTWSLGITALELATGQPPLGDIHPMKVLFIIPKNPAPVLEGDFSKEFKHFVSRCLVKDVKERATTRELMKHPWIKKAKRTAYLTELIERHERWQANQRRNRNKGHDDGGFEPRHTSQEQHVQDDDLWDFGTVRPAGRAGPAAGGLRPMNEVEMNSRNTPLPILPTPRSDGNKENSDASTETPTGKTLRGNMAPPPPPKTPSPTKRPVPILTPSAAAQVPLPVSPTRKPVGSGVPHTPPPPSFSSSQGPSAVDASPKPPATPSDARLLNDDFLQQSIASDMSRYMKGLALNDGPQIPAPKLQPTAAPTDRQSSAMPSPAKAAPLPQYMSQQSSAPISASAPPQQVARPAAAPVEDIRRPQSTPAVPAAAPSASPVNEPPRITALDSVIIPALEAALHRRSYHLALYQKEQQKAAPNAASAADAAGPSARRTSSGAASLSPELQSKRAAHDHIRKCMGKLVRLLHEIDQTDENSPVSMGDGVGGLLEGFLEEMLCRVEAEDA